MQQPTGECRRVRVAAVSLSARKFDIEGNARKLANLFREAAANGAELALGPEGALDGIVAMGVLEGEWPAVRALDASLTIDDQVIIDFQRLAAELGVCLSFGFAERIGDEIYNTALFIDNNGDLAGKYHKMVLAEGYHSSWWFNRIGSESRAIETPFGRCGFMICYDRWDPRAAGLPVLDGATFLLVPTYGQRGDHNDREVLARARENGVPLVQANGTGASLIISGGETIARHFSPDENGDAGTITMATIAIPTEGRRDEPARQALEREYLEWRGEHLPARFLDRRKDYLAEWGGTRRP